jgi:outer membrane protein OmpA-like peptidoglycan-associated protein
VNKITFVDMRNTLFWFVLWLIFGSQNLYGQCDFITPPAVKKINDASRELTFSDVTINGKETTYLAVRKGETVKISTRVSSKKNGDYCPGCIVQIYWGINGYTSVCAKSFYGYQFSSKKSTHQFEAPMEEGIYYITMGSTLDYSCKNNIERPRCSPDDAFAVLKVGNPDPEKKMMLTTVKRGNGEFLKTTLLKPGCFGDLDKITWFLGDEKLAYDNQKEIPLTQFGNYQAVWSNCLESVAKSYNYGSKEEEVKVFTVNPNITSPNGTNDKEVGSFSLKRVATSQYSKDNKEVNNYTLRTVSTAPKDADIAGLIASSDKFVLKNMIFELSKSAISPEAKKDLDQLAQIMRDKPSMKILLEGHTDKRGNAKKNQELSEERVAVTKDYLVKQGVVASNIQTKGWGDQKPLIVTQDVAEGKINRRVEVRILSR